MSRKGVRNREQDGGAHGRAHAESGRPQSGLTSGISLAAGAGSAVVDGRHGPALTSRCRPAADIAAATADFQDGETTQQHTRRRKRRSRHNSLVGTGENNTELTDSSSSSLYHIQQCPVTVDSSSCSTARIANILNSSSRNSVSNTTTIGNNQQAKIKGDFLPNIVTTTICNNKKTVFLQEASSDCDNLSFKTIATIDSSSHNNNTTMAIRDLQYLSNSSDYAYDEDEDVEDANEDLENGSEWFKSRCRNFDSVVGFELVDPTQATTHGVVVDSLDIGTGKASKDITVDDLFAGEHLSVSPGPAVVIPTLAGTDHHVVLPSTERTSVVLYTSSPAATNDNDIHNSHSNIVLNGVDSSVMSPSTPNPNNSIVSTNNVVANDTGLNCPVATSPVVSKSSSTTGSSINTICATALTTRNAAVALERAGSRGYCTSSTHSPVSSTSTKDTMGHHQHPTATDGQEDTLALHVPLLDFKRVGTDKSNTLMTPQELESMPDQGIEFEESVGPKQETHSPPPPCLGRDSLSVISSPQNPIPQQKTVHVSTSNITTNNNNNICSPTSVDPDSFSLETKPIFINNSLIPINDAPDANTTNKTNLSSSSSSSSSSNPTINPSTTISTTTTTTTTNSVTNNGVGTPLNTNLLNAGNFTLATISISTDRSTNSTQILVNTNQGQQVYQINTADLTKAQTLPVVQPEAQTSSPHSSRLVTTATTAVSSQTTTNGASSQTGYLLLPMTPADNSNDILVTNPVNNNGLLKQVVKQESDQLQWMTDVKEEVSDDTDSKSDSPSEPSSLKKEWPCSQAGCEQVFKKLSKLKIHLMRHTGERPFRCNQPGCDWAFTTAYKLKRHIESHQGRKDYICDIDGCGRKFTTIYNLNSHKKLHERPCNEVCPKPNCDQRFPTKRQVDLHLKNHTDVEKTYKCPVEGCDKVFLSPNCMGSHARVHQQDRDELVCKYEGCGKMFSKVCRLKLHVRCHTGEKPYQCRFDGCTWAFATASKLKRHMSKHTGVRKWLCNACGKAFMRAEHLKGHMVKHSGTKPFQCSVDGCKTRFTAKSSLYIHLKKHDHSEEKIIYPCPMEGCEKKYSTKVSLRNHIMKHYNPNNTSASDSSQFDLVPLLVTDDMDSLGQQTHIVNQATPVSGVHINNALSNSIIGTTDPVLIGSSSDYVSADSEKLLSVAVNSAQLFNPAESLPQHGITLRDPETGITYVQTQLLQDDPPNPELYPGENSLVSELSLHDSTSTTTGDSVSEHGVSSSEFTGTTINLQDLE